MSETVNTPGIVLHYEPWREVDRRYVIYTEQLGKIRATALGVRRSKAKLAGVLEPYAEAELYFILGKTTKIGGAVIQHRFASLQTDLAKRAAAVYLGECLDRLVQAHSPDQRVYHLLYTTLTWLERSPYTRLLPVSYAFKLVQALGYDAAQTLRSPAALKIARWLVVADYADIQKLRLDNAIWQELYQGIHLWFYEYLHDDVQSEQFLV